MFLRCHRRVVGAFRSSALLWMVASGCAIENLGRQEVATYVEQRARAAPAMAGVYAEAPAVEESASEEIHSTGGLQAVEGLRGYLLTALENNPDIKAAEETARAKVERIRQVTALPDPMLNTKTLVEPARTAEGDNFFILGVSQTLPVPEKLLGAGRVALEETRMALEQLQATRLRIIAEVKRAYHQLYVIDRSMEVTQANQGLLEGLIDVARTQVASGRRSQDDVLRAQVELSNLEAELIALRQRRVSVAARLNEILDRPPRTEVRMPDEIGVRRTDAALETLLEKAARANPELQRLQHQIERDREALQLAELARWPDFTVGFEWMLIEPRDAFQPPRNPTTGQRPVVSTMSEDGTDNWAITFGFNLPIWFDKIDGGIEENRNRLAASQQQYRSAMNRVEFAVEDALERVLAQQDLARLFRDTIIPQAEQAYRVSQASYTGGTSDFLDVIDNWRKWLVFNIQFYRSLGDLERSVADLEQAIGLSLSEVGGS